MNATTLRQEKQNPVQQTSSKAFGRGATLRNENRQSSDMGRIFASKTLKSALEYDKKLSDSVTFEISK